MLRRSGTATSIASFVAIALGCGSEPPRTPDPLGRPILVAAASDAATPRPGDACADGADSVYVWADDGRILLFEPDGPIEQRFRPVATPDCPDAQPQTMALDHRGVAWLLYSSGRLFTMRLPDGVCEETSYRHAGAGDVMGMTFTAVENGSTKERLFISDRKGLFEVKIPSLEGVLLDASVPVGELAGGPDGLLFHIDMDSGMLSELDPRSFDRRPVHAFEPRHGAFTILRHRRGFFYFAADPGGPSHIYRWSPRSAETIDLGMAPDGIRVLGRAQSVCVEWSDADAAAPPSRPAAATP